jgi:hypothetical protein
MNLDSFLGYLQTYSGYVGYLQQNPEKKCPLLILKEALLSLFENESLQEIEIS